MLIFTKIADLQKYLKEVKTNHLSVGFVPTMGALHQGHISLIKASKAQCDLSICSIFVNPRQFNDPTDLARYPRMPEKDAELLKHSGCSVLFLPQVEEIYPDNSDEDFDFGHLDLLLEAKYRPGHFKGVAQVLKRFFDIIQPDKAYFGIKDYQQVLIVKALIQKMNSPIQIISSPILREKDGLAMSSRNALLSNEERALAALIPKWMKEAKQIVLKKGIIAAKDHIHQQIEKVPNMKMDYFEVCEAETLLPVSQLDLTKDYVVVIALFVGKIRLIDNCKLN